MTNKPMLSVERKLLVRLCNLNAVGWEDIEPEMKELRALLDQPVDSNELSLGGSLARAASGLINVLDDEAGAWTETEALKRALEDWSMGKPAAQHQGEPVACMPVDRCYDVRAKMIIAFNETKKAGGDLDDALDAAYKSALRYSPNPMTAEQPAPVAVVLPFAEKIISKLRRFDECASDGQGVDIGRHWFDLLTQLGLLNRVQRSPALWEITQQGEDVLEATRLNTPQYPPNSKSSAIAARDKSCLKKLYRSSQLLSNAI